MKHVLSQGIFMMAAALSFSSLASAQSNPSAGSSPSASTSTASTASSTPTDPQIAQIAVTADQVDIDAGKMAESKTKNKEVREFAKEMVKDHSMVNKQAMELAKKLKMTPEENPTSQSLKKAGQDNMANLKNLKGGDFDKAYVNQEVSYHQQVLESLDKTLIPNAKNQELKDLLQKTRPVVASHLEHAQHLQAKLNK